MFCSECGTQNPDTNQFCRNCGKPLGRRQPSAAQPAAIPVPYPAAQPVPAAAAPYQPPAAPAVQAAAPVPVTAPKRRWNWLGMGSLLCGIVSLAILPLILALAAILLGAVGTFLFRKATGRVGISGIIGIVLGIAAIVMTVLV